MTDDVSIVLVGAAGQGIEGPKYPLGVIYTNPDKPTFEDSTRVYAEDSRPLHEKGVDYERLSERIRSLI